MMQQVVQKAVFEGRAKLAIVSFGLAVIRQLPLSSNLSWALSLRIIYGCRTILPAADSPVVAKSLNDLLQAHLINSRFLGL